MSAVEKVVKTSCHSCFMECLVLVHVENGKVVDIRGNPECPIFKGAACIKGRRYTDIAYHPDRLKYPLKKTEEGFKRISWDEALDTMADKFQEIRQKYGPLSFAASTKFPPRSWATILFIRSLGSPHFAGQALDFCEGTALLSDSVTITNSYVTNLPGPLDFERTNLVLSWGGDPARSHPPIWRTILERKAKDQLKLIAIDPRYTGTAERADAWYRIKPGTDGALAMALLNVIINEELYDKDFVDKWCVGFEKLKERVQEWPPEKADKVTGIGAQEIETVARTYAMTKPAILWGRTGLMQQKSAFQTSRAQSILVAITGNIDIPGGHLLPKVLEGCLQDRDMIVLPEFRLPPEVEAKSAGVKEFPITSFWRGSHNVSITKAVLRGEIKGMWVTYTNPLVGCPNTREVWESLNALEFLVVSDLFLTPTAEVADILLPATTWLEKDEIAGSLHWQYVLARQKAIEPMYECWDDRKAVFELTKRMKSKGYALYPFIKWGTVDEYNDYCLKGAGLTFEELKERVIISIPLEYKEYHKFRTPSGKVELYSSLLEKHGYDPLPNYVEPPLSEDGKLAKRYPLTLLQGGKVPSFYHTQFRQLGTAMRKANPDPVVSIHPDDAAKRGIKESDWVWIETIRGRVKQKAKITDRVPTKMIHAQHGWWYPEKPGPDHGLFESNINVITPNDPCDPVSGSPHMRRLLCEVRKVEDST